MGYSFIMWVVLLLAVNIYFVVKEMFRLSKMSLIKRWNIFYYEKLLESKSPELTQTFQRRASLRFFTSLNNLKSQKTLKIESYSPTMEPSKSRLSKSKTKHLSIIEERFESEIS